MLKILKWIVIALILFGAFMFYFRFFSGNEDTWICESGKWIKHGNPSAAKPTEKCK